MKTIIKLTLLPLYLVYYLIKGILWLILLFPLAIINALANQ